MYAGEGESEVPPVGGINDLESLGLGLTGTLGKGTSLQPDRSRPVEKREFKGGLTVVGVATEHSVGTKAELWSNCRSIVQMGTNAGHGRHVRKVHTESCERNYWCSGIDIAD